MKKTISRIGVGALLAVSALTFASCGSSSATTTKKITVDDDHVINYYHTQGDALQKITDEAIAAFEADFPEYQVKQTQVGGYDDVKTKIISDLQAGTQPDIAYCYPDHVAQYMQTKKVVDLSQFMTSTETVTTASGATKTVGYTDAELSDFISGYLAEGKATNFGDYEEYGYTSTAYLTMPYVKSTDVLYYNKTALDEAGFTAPTTWDELWEQVDYFYNKYEECIPLGVDSEANWFITMCEQNGWDYTSASYPHYKFNNDNTAAWLTTLQQKFKANKFTTQTMYGNYTSNLFTSGAEACIFSIGSSGGASHQASNKFEVGVAQLPGSVVDGKTVTKSISQGPDLVMLDTQSKNTEKQKMTWIFMKYLLEPEFQSKFSQNSGYISPRISVRELASYKSFLDGDDLVAKTAKLASQDSMIASYYTSPAFIGSSTARTQVGSVLTSVLSGSDPATALAAAVKSCGE